MAVPSAVIAGSRSFADALLAPLRLRLGAAPLVAGDPSALIASGTSATGLVVLEYSGTAWLEAVRDVRIIRAGRPIAIVAAVPAARSGDIPALRSAGVDETVPFDLRVDPVLWAVDRVLANLPRPTPVVRRVAANGAARDAAPDEVTEVTELTMLAPGAPGVPAPPVAAVAAPADVPLDPSSLPAGAALEELLAAALAPRDAGAPLPVAAGPDDALQRAARRFTAQLTDLERAALSGQPLPAEAGPIRAAAALRFRVSTVLQHARAAGGALDEDAAGELTAQVDGALAALKATSAGLPAEVQRAIGLSRNALVAEAIVLTEAMARLTAPGEPAGAPAAAGPGVERHRRRSGGGRRGGDRGIRCRQGPVDRWPGLRPRALQRERGDGGADRLAPQPGADGAGRGDAARARLPRLAPRHAARRGAAGLAARRPGQHLRREPRRRPPDEGAVGAEGRPRRARALQAGRGGQGPRGARAGPGALAGGDAESEAAGGTTPGGEAVKHRGGPGAGEGGARGRGPVAQGSRQDENGTRSEHMTSPTTPRRRPPRGFTLIEVMVTAAIVGMLSSIALPEYGRVLLRARAAERGTVMNGIHRAMSETIGTKESVPGGTWVGAPNPAGPLQIGKRHFDPSISGWALIPLVVEGDTYYTYSFFADDPSGSGQSVTVTVTGEGDLDMDGVHSVRTDAYVGVGWTLQPDPVEAHWTREVPSTL